MPVCTSSSRSRSLCSSQSLRTALRKDGGSIFTPPSPWIGSISIAPVWGPITLQRFEIAVGNLIETFGLWAKAFEIFRRAGGGEGGQRAAMEGTFEADDLETLGVTRHILIAARDLDREFERLGARIREEHIIGEARLAKPLGEALAVRNLEQI